MDAITAHVIAAIDYAAEARGQKADHGALISVAEGSAALAFAWSVREGLVTDNDPDRVSNFFTPLLFQLRCSLACWNRTFSAVQAQDGP